jgi:chromate reductase, NAD(P)H dehydrogenase (quinone)
METNPSPIEILGIAGSLRRGSLNKAALRAAQQLAPPQAVIESFDIADLPLYNEDLWTDGAPPPRVLELKRAVRAADAILLVTPEYNYSFSGVLKNALDWASRPYGDNAWKGKPVAIMGASGGALGTGRAQYHLRQCFVFLEMYALNQPEVLINHATQKFDAKGNLTDEPTRERIRQMLAALIDLTRRLRTPAAAAAALTS